MQKVLIVHNRYRIAGGEDVVAANEAELLRSHGHEVFMYERSNAEPLAGLRMPFVLAFNLRSYFAIRCLIRREGIDIVHVHNTLHLISPAVFYAAAAEGVPVVQTIHNFRLLCPAATFYRRACGICEECLQYGTNRALWYGCYRNSRIQTAAMLMAGALHKSSGIYRKVNLICLTEFNKNKLAAFPAGRVFVKPNFTPPAERKPCGGYYLALGRIEHMKGSALIARAFAKNGKKLIFAGDGEQLAALRHFIQRRKATNIECRGQLAHEEAMRLLAGAKALVVVPQWYEGMSMNILEAYARAVPVIAVNIGNAGSMVQDGVTGIKYENNPSSLCAAVERFESMDRELLSRAALREYEEKYAPEVNYRLLKEIYDSL